MLEHRLINKKECCQTEIRSVAGEGSLVNKVAVQTSFRRIVNSGRFQTTEAEFLDEIQTKVFRDFLLAVNSHI